MTYKVCFQTEPEYKNKMYGHNTIYNSACGCAALVNALYKIDGKAHSLVDMCKFAVNCKARVDGGTDMSVLLKNAESKFGIKWRATSKNVELWSHLKKGYPAIMWCGNTNKIFSNSGHFVCAYEAIGENTVRVLDSYWYDDKFTSTALRKSTCKVKQKGVVDISLTNCGKATIDRCPSYFLIEPVRTENKPKKEEETDDMVYYKTIDDVPAWAKPTIEKLLDKKAMVGVGNGVLNVSDDLCRVMVVLDRLGKI